MTATRWRGVDDTMMAAGFARVSAAHALRVDGASVLLTKAQEQAGEGLCFARAELPGSIEGALCADKKTATHILKQT